MIPRALSSLVVRAALCAFIPVAVSNAQSAIAKTWEIKKIAFDVPSAIYDARPDGGPLDTVIYRKVIASRILVIDSPDLKARSLAEGAFPAWSPDGAQLAYCTGEVGGFGQIQIINADGSGKKQLTNMKGGACYPDWSPDGTKIIFTAFGGRNQDVFVMDKDGKNLTHIVAGYGAHWSPDGSKLVFMRGPEKGGPRQSIWVATADGKEAKVAVQGDSLQDAKWLPDGKGIVFSAPVSVNLAIFLSHLNGAQPRTIENDDTHNLSEPAISPDGKHLVAVVTCVPDHCRDDSSFDSILLVDAGTHQRRSLGYGSHPSVIWAGN